MYFQSEKVAINCGAWVTSGIFLKSWIVGKYYDYSNFKTLPS